VNKFYIIRRKRRGIYPTFSSAEAEREGGLKAMTFLVGNFTYNFFVATNMHY
jgi:hypothetical protein